MVERYTDQQLLDAGLNPALLPIVRRESGGKNVGWEGLPGSKDYAPGGTDLSGYPLKSTGFPAWPGKMGPEGNSTAAGPLQIVGSTWDPIARKLGVTDFSLESNVKVANELYRQSGTAPWRASEPGYRRPEGYDPETGTTHITVTGDERGGGGLSPTGSALLDSILKNRYGAAEEPTGNDLLDGLLKSSLFGTTQAAPQPAPTDDTAKQLQQFTPPPPPQTVPELSPGQPVPTPRIQPIQQPAMPTPPPMPQLAPVASTPMPGQPSVPSAPPVQPVGMPIPPSNTQGDFYQQNWKQVPPPVLQQETPGTAQAPGSADRNRFFNEEGVAPYRPPGVPDDREQEAAAPTGDNILDRVLKQVSPISTAQAAERPQTTPPATQPQAPPAKTGNSLLDSIIRHTVGRDLSDFRSPFADLRKEGWAQLTGAPIGDPSDPKSLANAALDLEHGPAMAVAMSFAGGGEGRIPRPLSHVEPPPLRTEPPPIGASAPAGPAPGTTRLYRGIGGGSAGTGSQAGGWFTTDPAKAALYGKVHYVDVTRDDLKHFAQGHGGPDEFVTDNKDIIGRARAFDGGAGGRPPGEPPEGPKPPEPEERPEAAKPDLIDRLMRRTPEVKAAIGDAQALDDDLHLLRQKSQKDMIEARQLVEDLPEEMLDPKVQEQVYHEVESRMTGKPEPQSPVTTKLLKLFKPWTDRLFDNVKWLHENAADVAQELPETNLRRTEEGYVHRKSLGKNIPGERLDPSASDVITGSGRSLPRTSSAAQHRKGEFVLEDNAGNRQPGQGPLVGQKGGPSYGQKITDARTGTVYTVKEATTREIEAKYGGKERYSKNWLANTIDAGLRTQRVVDATKLLQKWRAQMVERGNFIESGGSPPVGDRRKYVRVDLPQFHGWMQQHHADVLNRFYRTSQGAILDYIEKASKYIIGSMFALPVRHIENVGAHYVVGRGFDNLYSNPHLASAIREVASQGPRYLKLLEQGAGFQLPSVLNENFYETMLQKLFHDQMLDPEWHNIAARVGMKVADLVKAEYAWSRKSLWKWNDVFLTARIFELESKGMSTARAIKAAEKEIPNYRIPVEVMRSRFLSQLLQSPLIAFGRYAYGRGRAIAEMIKDMVGPHATGEERVRAIGQATVMAALGTAGYQIANSALNKALVALGIRKEDDPPMGFSGFGPIGLMRTGMTLAGIPTDIPWLSQALGDPVRDPATREWRDELASLITPNPVITTALEFASNTDFFRRRPMIDPQSSAKGQMFQAGEGMLGSLYPFQVVMDIANRGVVAGLGPPLGMTQQSTWQPRRQDVRRGVRREARDPLQQGFDRLTGGGDSDDSGGDVDAGMARARADVAGGKIGEAESELKNLGLSPAEIKSLIQTYQQRQQNARPAH